MVRLLAKSLIDSAPDTADHGAASESHPAYVPPPQVLKKLVWRQKDAGGSETVSMSAATYYKLLEMAMRPLFDEEAYLKKFPDIREAVKAGTIPSGLRHFVTNGYLEGRGGLKCEVDEAWYCQTYPDVAAAIRAGKVRDAKHHFEDFGFFEGRVPGKAYLGPSAEWRELEKRHAMKK